MAGVVNAPSAYAIVAFKVKAIAAKMEVESSFILLLP
jgi:hypothetical protein